MSSKTYQCGLKLYSHIQTSFKTSFVQNPFYIERKTQLKLQKFSQKFVLYFSTVNMKFLHDLKSIK